MAGGHSQTLQVTQAYAKNQMYGQGKKDNL